MLVEGNFFYILCNSPFRTELQKVDFDDAQLLEILRGKDNQIVALEGQVRKKYDNWCMELKYSLIRMKKACLLTLPSQLI